MPARKEGGVQTRHYKDVGEPVRLEKLLLKGGKSIDHLVSNASQTNKFKPANHGVSTDTPRNGEVLSESVENLLEQNPGNSDKGVAISKSKSCGSSNAQTRSRGLKTLRNEAMENISRKEGSGMPDQLVAEDEMLVNNGTNSSASLTASTGEEKQNKLRSDNRQLKRINSSKNKDEQLLEEDSSKSDVAPKKSLKDKKTDNKDKERICVDWIKDINRQEAKSSTKHVHAHNDDDMPKYCSNQICPISENKIPKDILKVQNLAKKIILRKVIFQGNDERWY